MARPDAKEEGFYQLLASTRYDPFLSSLTWNNDLNGPSPFLLLPYQYERILSSAKIHGWYHVSSVITYSDLRNACQNAVAQQLNPETLTSSALRLRITVSAKGRIDIITSPLKECFDKDPTLLAASEPPNNRLDPQAVKLVLDKEITSPSIFTETKTTDRSLYDNAKKRNKHELNQIPEEFASDVLLYNREENITEATIFNVAFWRYSRWITPPVSSGCLPGVMRRKLLEAGRITEDDGGNLTKDSIKAGEWVLLFNGVQGCRLGKIESL